jgi:hypothetical protein
MERLMRTLAIFLVSCAIFFSPTQADAKDKKKDVPVAPLPAVIVNARKIFLSNGGGSNLAYDAFYSKMKEWGRYEIVGSPEEADLIVELSYRVEDKGTRIWSTENTDNNAVHIYGGEITDPQLILAIYDAKTKNSLWSETDHSKLAKREKNREKETINSAQRLIVDLQARVAIPQ